MKQTEIARLLPAVFQRTLQEETPLFALLGVMEALQAADEAVLDQLEAFFNPYRTPDSFVPFLASWLGLEWLLLDDSQEFTALTPSLPSGVGRFREVVAAAKFLGQWRGTAKGLLHFLETASGVQGFLIEERVMGSDGRPRPFHLSILAPPAAAPYMTMMKRIIESEKPAYVTYDLQLSENEQIEAGKE